MVFEKKHRKEIVMAYERFLSKGKIGKLELKNRAVFPPMGSGYADEEGFITQQLIDYHVRRVQGGCGMNIVEIAVVHYTSYNPHTPGIWDDKFLPGLTKLAHAIKDAGGVPCLQLWHGGRQQSGKGAVAFEKCGGPFPSVKIRHEGRIFLIYCGFFSCTW